MVVPVTKNQNKSSPSQSISFSTELQKPSEKLNKVRAELLKLSGAISDFPLLEADRVTDLVNDYLGPDALQEIRMTITIKDVLSDIDLSKFLANEIFASQTLQILLQYLPRCLQREGMGVFIRNVHKIMLAEPFIGSCPFIEMQTNFLYNLALHIVFRDAAISTAEHFSNELGEEWLSSAITELHERSLIPCFNTFYSQKKRIFQSDREHIDRWISKIVPIHQLALNSLHFNTTGAKGVTFTIKNAEKLYGYLYGTIHNLPNNSFAKKITKLSGNTQQRLRECAILGTEAFLDPKMSQSFEWAGAEYALISYAYRNGIAANIAIDDENYEHPKRESSSLKYEGLEDEICTQFFARAYFAGDTEQMKYATNGLAPIDDPKLQVVKRNIAMSEHIDALLKGCDKVQQTIESSPIKCFFAVGYAHLLSKKDSIVDFLTKKGWTVELIHD